MPTREMNSGWLTVGRAIFGGYFIYNGINHFVHRKDMAAYARAKGVPWPEAAVVTSGAMLIAGGVSLVTGTRPKTGASLIAGFLMGVTPIMHAFWREAGQARQADTVHFLKNVALVGGASLAAAAPEPWPGSVDARIERRRTTH